MAAYVFIHGAWHGAWCWEKVTPLLEKAGHTVYAIDLPGHGSDQTPISQVSLKSYTDKVCSILDDAEESVYLVGHSMGGIVVSQSAEYRSEKVKALIYVSAFLRMEKL
jgi:pimeloyl-ACP methyl ester carboxylesterase